jgi:L-alanine-DL-glutamate epimerase-like enolase superfamily enzyme
MWYEMRVYITAYAVHTGWSWRVKITDVRLTVFERPIGGDASEITVKGHSMATLMTETVALEVVTDEGVTGEVLSMGGGRGLAHYMANTIRPLLVGRDPLMREAIFQDLWSADRMWFLPQFAIGTVEVAIWDLYGKVVGRPLHEILGGYRDRIGTYASSMTKSTSQEFVDEALEYKERGFHAYKVHPFGEAELDIALAGALRAAVGDDYPLMLDAAAAYDQIDALRVGKVVQELGFLWYEEPLQDYDIGGYRRLSDKLDITVTAGEVMGGSLYAIADYVASGAIGMVRADPTFKMGIGQTRKLAALAEAFGMRCEIHTNPNPVLDAAALHCALSIKNTTYFEQLVPERLFANAVKEPVYIDTDGYAHAPTGPGLGVEIDWDFVRSRTIAVL